MINGILSLSLVASRSKMAFLVFLCAFFSASFSACQESLSEDYTKEEVWLISPKTEKRVINELRENEFECMVITSLSPSRPEPFYIPLNSVRGFDYQTGYEYKVEVWVTKLANPPKDSSNQTLTLKRVLSKEQRLTTRATSNT